MEFRILGPIEVVENGQPAELGGRKQRALLAALVLNANAVVSSDALVDAIWGEQPPQAAAKTLQAYVSRLRKALNSGAGSASNDRLETRGQGYLLHIEAGELDADRCRTMLEAARNELAEGKPDAASDSARDALALFRGPPLPDVAYESFAQAEIAHLEELRLGAQEEWIEAQLALGRHAEVVAKLEELVRHHPLRERLLGQLMIARYRCGRHAEALHAYQESRRALAEELGLEPSKQLQALELRILDHNPDLAAPPRRSRPGAVPSLLWRRPRTAVLAGVLVLASAAAAGAVQLARGGHEKPGLVNVAGSAVATLDAGSGSVRHTVASPVAPATMAAGLGRLWIGSADSNRVLVVDPETNTVRDSIPVESAPGGIAIGGGWVWVTNSLTGTVSQISPQTLDVVQTIPVGNGPTGVAVGGGHVWVANTNDHTVSKLRAADGKLVDTFPAGPDPGALAYGEGAVWVASTLAAAVVKLSPETGEILDRTPVGEGPAAVAFGSRSVWVASRLSGTVTRLDPRTGDVREAVTIGPSADAVTVTTDGVWAASETAGTVSRIDPNRTRVTAVDVVGSRPTALAAADDTVYVGVRPDGAAHVGGTLRVVESPSGPPQIDSANAYTPTAWRNLILTNDGLVGWRRIGGQPGTELVPDLAVSLPTVSDDGRRYTFQLRRGIRYSNGRRLKASDVRYSIERVYRLKPTPEPAAVEFYRTILGAERCADKPSRCDLSRGILVDDRTGTVTFRLSRQDPELLFKLALPFAYVVPKGTPLNEAVLRPLPATGPYRVASTSADGSIRFARNPRFREWSSGAQPQGFPDEILIRTIPGTAARARLVTRDKADFLTTTFDEGITLTPALRARFHTQPGPNTSYLILNTTRPPFNDQRARQAVNYAVDRNKTIRLSVGADAARPTCQILPQNFPGYRPHCSYTLDPNDAAGWTAPDVLKAKRLVAASRAAGTDVTLWWHRDFGEQAGRYIVQLLDSLGFRAHLRLFSGDMGRYFQALSRHGAAFDLAGTNWAADYTAASNFVNLLSCTSPYNWGRFCDRTVDAEIRAALRLQQRDQTEANKAWAALDRELTERAPWVFLYNNYDGDLVSNRVGNYQHHPLWGALLGQFWVR